VFRDERWHMIRNMAENGMKISEIAKELNMDRKTVKKYVKSRTVPRYGQRKKTGLKLDPYRDSMSFHTCPFSSFLPCTVASHGSG